MQDGRGAIPLRGPAKTRLDLHGELIRLDDLYEKRHNKADDSRTRLRARGDKSRGGPKEQRVLTWTRRYYIQRRVYGNTCSIFRSLHAISNYDYNRGID